jgi:hypothetical protein
VQNYYGQVIFNQDNAESNKKVDVYLKFNNSKKESLGLPLPSGRIRVSKLDRATNTMEFVGEDVIDHTPKDEEVRIKLGSAFDVVGDRKVMNFNVDESRHQMEESIEIQIKNHKDQDIKVTVKENLFRGQNWKIVSSSTQYEKKNANTIEFPIEVKKSGEIKLQYTIRYTW